MTAIGHNDTEAKRWVGECLRVYDQLDEARIEHMNRCRDIRARLPTIYESAKGAGLSVKALKAALRVSLATRKLAALVEKVTPEDEEDADVFEQLRAIATPGDLFDFATKPRAVGLPGANAEFA